MDIHQSNPEEKLSVFQLLILVLSILVLAALIVDTLAPISSQVSKILQTLDTVVCVLFLIDFGIRYWRAENKFEFMKWGWLDLVASIPNVDLLRAGRIVRILRIIRLLRGLRAGQKMVSLVLQNKPKSAFSSLLLTMILLVTFSSIAILIAEDVPGANIKSAEEAVWWSMTTVTTVGYGDKYPISTEGRFIAVVLMLAGVGLFGTLSGLVASYFLGARERNASQLDEVLARLDALTEKVEQLNRQEPRR